MNSNPPELMDRLVPAACSELFAAYGVALRRVPSVTAVTEAWNEEASGGLVNFVSASMTGSLVLVASFKFIAASRPPETRRRALTRTSSSDWILVRDWTTELVNQLLGRLRNRLYGHDVPLDWRNPTALSGHSLVVAMKTRSKANFEFIASDGQTLRIWCDARFHPTLAPAAPQSRDAVPIEGDVILF